jgi:YgiT-type zinc finger domain-containing protein
MMVAPLQLERRNHPNFLYAESAFACPRKHKLMDSAYCPRCNGTLIPMFVKTAIWQGDRLFVVEDVPAQVCSTCIEQYYDEQVTDTLRRMTEEGFPALKAKREILVPVFSLEGIKSHVPA